MMNSYRNVAFGFDDLGFDEGHRKKVAWSEEYSTNAHMLIAGKSGTGKTFTLRRIVDQMTRPLPGRDRPRVYVFDVHGDIRFENESRVLFSESTYYGINPLYPSSDVHHGGVRKCVQNFIEMLNESSPRAALGGRQIAALRHVLYELFDARGFDIEDPRTWVVEDEGGGQADAQGRIYLDIPYDEKDIAKSIAQQERVTLQFCPVKRSWWCSAYVGGLQRWATRAQGRRAPTVPDAARFLAAKIKQMQIGGSGVCVKMLEEHTKKVQTFQRMLRKRNTGAPGGASDEEVGSLKDEIQEDAMELTQTFSNFVLSIESGRELDAMLRYESLETLKSLSDRLETLVSSGIFRSRRPPFEEDKPVWVYDLSPLREAEQKFFTWTCLKQIFSQAKETGVKAGASDVETVIVLDEAHKFFSPKEGNILDEISKEARKFGVSLICASQSPTHFSEDFLSNVGTKILLGLDAMFHDQTVRRMRIEPGILDYVVAGKIAAIQVSDKRNMSHRFVKTRVG